MPHDPEFEDDEGPDFLDELIAEETALDPDFPVKLQALIERRDLLAKLNAERERQAMSQASVAAAMATSQSTIARLESAGTDTKLSTVERYAATLGMRIEYHLVPIKS
ncbi:MAG TPA: helix-turn-helix transcriptional regulator [Baekduia sp.]|jgi:ribosome-binding protein aMBF1 (putative translation factor)